MTRPADEKVAPTPAHLTSAKDKAEEESAAKAQEKELNILFAKTYETLGKIWPSSGDRTKVYELQAPHVQWVGEALLAGTLGLNWTV